MPDIETILRELRAGRMDLAEAFALAKHADPVTPVAQDDALLIARLDAERPQRCGFPEFIYGAGKTTEELVRIIPALQKTGSNVLVTRVNPEAGPVLSQKFPQAVWDERGRTFLWRNAKKAMRRHVVILTAGTSDLGIAKESQATLSACDFASEIIADVGIAAIHRLFAVLNQLRKADVIIAIAGMEGALPGVVAGLVAQPVIAVPTSIGYGANQHGMTPLMGMLSSCASGISVVNIDNGFGAACVAVRILHAMEARQKDRMQA